MKNIFALVIAALLLAPCAVLAETEKAPETASALSGLTAAKSVKYTFDPAHTQIIFAANHLGFSFSHGRFMKFDGFFTFDPAAPESSEVNVTVETASVDMGSDKWDEHLKGADFLNVEKFPQMTFKSTKIEKTCEKTGKLTGDFTLLGVTKPVTLDVTYNGSGVHPYSNNNIAGFSAAGTIKRSEFGMTGSIPAVGDDVFLIIQVEGIRQDFDGLNKK